MAGELSQTAIDVNIDAIIKVNGNYEITPPLDKTLRKAITNSYLNKVDGGSIVGAVFYTTEITITDSKTFVHKKYVDDSIAAIDLSPYVLLAGGVIEDGGGFDSVDTINRFLIHSNGTNVYDWQNGYLYDSGAIISLNIQGRNLYATSSISIDYETKILADTSSSVALDWGQRQLKDISTVISVDWASRTLKNSLNQISIDWENGYLTTPISTSLHWGNRTLNALFGAVVANWDTNFEVRNNANFAICNTIGDYGGGAGVFYIGEALTAPSVAPTTGAILWVDATTGETKITGRSGTITTIAIA